MPRSNEIVGPYKLVHRLGKGAFGEVWLAERTDVIAAPHYAIKFHYDDKFNRETVTREARLWVQASGHPYVLPIVEANIYDDQFVLVSEFASEGSLSKWLADNGGIAPTIESAIEMMSCILLGLEHLHQQNVVHRDLKPDNILIQCGIPRLADFGLSRVLNNTLSTAGSWAGTPLYMAPEAFKTGKENRSYQTDIWSSGVILYEMLIGQRPFQSSDLYSLIMEIANQDHPPLPSIIPDSLSEIVDTALQKDPTRRFSSASAMREALRQSLLADFRKPVLRVLGETHEVKQDVRISALLSSIEGNEIKQDSLIKSIGIDQPASIKKPIKSASFTTDLGKGIKLEMVALAGDKFPMGCPPMQGIDHERPQHEVEISSFFIGKYPITQGQWIRLMGSNPSYFEGETQPVENITWEDANVFCEKLSQIAKRRFRLPSEAEWEFACRAGSPGRYCFGNDYGLLSQYAWYNYNSQNRTHPVGSLEPNSFGLYDMHGNVWEWCQDWYSLEYYKRSPKLDPKGPSFGKYRVLRGGSWDLNTNNCRSAYRFHHSPEYHSSSIGFRVACDTEAS